MNNFEKASLATIGGGQAIRQFDYQLNQAVANCFDLNTDPLVGRTVLLKVTIKPSLDRKEAALTFQAVAKLAPDSAGLDRLYLSNGDAFVQDIEQLTFDEIQNRDAKNVMTIREEINASSTAE